MNHEQIHTTKQVTFSFQGKEHKLTARILVSDDELDFEAYGLSESQLEAIESGACSVMNVIVEVSLGGLKGIDSLGGVFVFSPEDVDQAIRDHGMIENALEDLKARLEDLLTTVGGAK